MSCGQCYLVLCDGSRPGGQYCKPGNSITVTATNLCPPNYALPNGGWCGPGRPHFDMAQPAWEAIAVYRAGIVPVRYRRVPCQRPGGVRFTVGGHSYFELVTVATGQRGRQRRGGAGLGQGRPDGLDGHDPCWD